MLLILFALAIAQSGNAIGATPPPPLPRPIANDPAVRAMIENARRCVDSDDARGAVDKAVRNLKAPVGSAEWKTTRTLVGKYIERRELARRCINDLEQFRYEGRISAGDRAILASAEQSLLSFWLAEGDYEAGILARLVGLTTDAGHFPSYMLRP